MGPARASDPALVALMACCLCWALLVAGRPAPLLHKVAVAQRFLLPLRWRLVFHQAVAAAVVRDGAAACLAARAAARLLSAVLLHAGHSLEQLQAPLCLT